MNDDVFIEEFKMNDSLMHYGTKGMQWGVHNDETKRKYGELPPKTQRRRADSVNPEQAKRHGPDKSLAEKGIELIQAKRQAKKDAKAAKLKAEQDAKNAEAAKQQRDAEIQRKYGVSAEMYDKIRERTLNSHDPAVVAKGMHLLTDSELNDKIQRMEKEAKITNMATEKRTKEAKAARAELERKQETLPYKLGKSAANAIVGQATSIVINKTVKPIVGSVADSMGKSGLKAVESLKTRAKEQVATGQVQDAVKQAKNAVKAADTASQVKANIGHEAVGKIRGAGMKTPKGSGTNNKWTAPINQKSKKKDK